MSLQRSRVAKNSPKVAVDVRLGSEIKLLEQFGSYSNTSNRADFVKIGSVIVVCADSVVLVQLVVDISRYSIRNRCHLDSYS